VALGSVTGSGNTGQVAYWNASNVLTSDPNFTWNNTNGDFNVVSDGSGNSIELYSDDGQIWINGGNSAVYMTADDGTEFEFHSNGDGEFHLHDEGWAGGTRRLIVNEDGGFYFGDAPGDFHASVEIPARDNLDYALVVEDGEDGNFTFTVDGSGNITAGLGQQFQINNAGNLSMINSVPYSFPSSQGALGTVLTNDGAGNLSWTLPPSSPVHNQGSLSITNTPLGQEESTTISNVMKLTPQASAPANPTEGTMYYNSVSHKLMVYDGTAWHACW
jgi:hypothetical protein